jgi:small subunit ribosomal protein S15
MALTPKQKVKVTKPLKRHTTDTGSPEYQVALLTEEIKKLTAHLKINKKDFHSRRGLLRKVSRRKKLLEYLARTNEAAYLKTISALGLKQQIS